MPTVPRYNPGQVQQQVSPGVRRTGDAPIEAFGGGVSRVTDAASGVMDVVSKLALKEKEKADDVRVMDAYAQAVKAKNTRQWDPKSGFVTRRGRDAAGVVDEYTPLLQKDLDDIEETLSNSDQKAQFRNVKSRLMTDFNDNLLKHTYGEGEKFAEETHKSVIDANQNDTVLNFSQPGKIEAGIKLQRDTLVDYAEKYGKGAEWLKVNVEKETSTLHTKIVNQMLTVKQDLAAKDYFDAHKDEFDADDKAKVQAAIREGYTQGEAQRQASALYNPKKENLREALDAARKANKDPDVQKAVVDEIKVRHSEAENIRKDNQEKLFRWASNYVSTNKSLPPADKMVQMSLTEQSALKQYVAGNVDTKWEVYEDLRDMAANPATRDQFLGLELSKQYAKDLNKSELEKLIDLKGMIRQGDEKTLQALEGIQNQNDIVSDTLGALGIQSNSKDEAVRKREKLFRRMVDKEVINRQKVTGKKITNEEVSEIAESLAVKENITHRLLGIPGLDYLWPDSDKPRFEMTPDEIPAEDKALIEQALKKRGISPTPEAYVHYYLKAKRLKSRANGQ